MFQFEHATHTYRVDGVKVPSVTQVLEGVGISDYSGVPPHLLSYAQELGAAVHDAAHAFDEDDLDWDSIAGSVTEPYVMAWNRFRSETGFKPRLIEHAGVESASGCRFGFRLDREGDLRGAPFIVEIKTGQPNLLAWDCQTAAYAIGIKRHWRCNRIAVQLMPDGKFKVHEFKEQTGLQIFSAALVVESAKRSRK